MEYGYANEEASDHPMQTDVQNFSNQKKRISKELFFACNNCNGPLVQCSSCKICKKTDMRVCVKCNQDEYVGEHRNCLRIILLDMKKRFYHNKQT